MIISGLSASGLLAQQGTLVLKEDTPTVAAAPKIAAGIPVQDWGQLESVVSREDWNRAVLLSKEYLDKLETETADRQIARLRYIYMYSLAGKMIAHSLIGERADEQIARNELKQAGNDFTGKEFVFPVRTILANCRGVVNYVCESKENAGFLRIAATNRLGSAIHSFEYVDMHSLLDVAKHNKKQVVLGGFLKAVRFNSGEPYLGVMVMQFENGFVKNIFEGN